MRTPQIILLLLLMTCLVTAQTATAQLNIVPNPGFEKYSSTPIGWFYKGAHFTSVMKYWSSPTSASPDVFGPRVRVPAHWASKGFGEQSARSGKSMVGLTAYGCDEGKPHCREYIQIQLAEPLVKGQKYYVEFWVTHLSRSLQVNNLGAYFSDTPFKEIIDVVIDAAPQIKADQVVSASPNNWKKISGSFEANSEASYLVIGNFYPDSLTKVQRYNSNSLNYAYYYVDDVQLRKEQPILAVPIKDDDLTRITIEEGKVVQLKNIFFDTNKAELLPRSNIELKKLLQLMNDNPTMVIEISGHTDSRGDTDYNLALSAKRAKAVFDYLIANGIGNERIRSAGYGSAKAIASNEDDLGRQMNRRVEFLILKK